MKNENIEPVRSTLRLDPEEEEILKKLIEKFRIGNSKNAAIVYFIRNFAKNMAEIEELKNENRDLRHSLRKAEGLIYGAKEVFKGLMDYTNKER